MTERKPITADLRRWWDLHCRTLATPELDEGLGALCGAIDAVHANLEGECESLRRELDRVLGEQEEPRAIAEATIAITPTLDWTGVARELRALADTLAGDAR